MDRAVAVSVTKMALLIAVAKVKFFGKLHASEKIVITAFVEYMLKGRTMQLNLRARKALGKSFGYVRAVDLEKGTYDVYFNASAGPSAVTLGYIAHELTHVIQYLRGDLAFDDTTFVWKGKPFIKVSEYNKLDYAKYAKLPWEREAIKNQKTKGREFLSTGLQNLKGQDPTLDYLIENNLLS